MLLYYMILDIICILILILSAILGKKRGLSTGLINLGAIFSIIPAGTFLAEPLAGLLSKIGLENIIKKHTLFYSNKFMLIISFVLILLIIIILSLILKRKMKSQRKKKSLIGRFDKFLGFLFGIISGILLIFIFLAFMSPFAKVFKPDILPAINENLNNSYFAGILYDNNPLLIFFNFFN